MTSSRRADAYAASHDPAASVAQTREERVRRLKKELREHIRYLSDYELLSPEWLRMSDSLHQISNVAFMESQLPGTGDDPLSMQGKKDTGTLWDQKQEELAVRILLEEGKLNLVLRILHSFMEARRDEPAFERMQREAAGLSVCDLATIRSRCSVFEQSVGQLLMFALRHEEAMQILDVPELLVHCKEVMEDGQSMADPQEVSGKAQVATVVDYLMSVARHFDKLDEERMTALFEQHRLLPMFTDHMMRFHGSLRVQLLKRAAVFFERIVSSESFITEPERFIGAGDEGDDVWRKLLDLQVLFINYLITERDLPKRDVKRLLLELGKAKRRLGASTAVFVELPFAECPSSPVMRPRDDSATHKKQHG